MAGRKNFKVGESIDVVDGSVVTRPDGSENTVTGTTYVLDVEGTFRLGEREVTVK